MLVYIKRLIIVIEKRLDDSDKKMCALEEKLQTILNNIDGSQSDVMDKTEKNQENLEKIYVQMKEFENNIKDINTELDNLSKLLKEHTINCVERIQSLGVEELSKSLDELGSKHQQNHEGCLDKINKFETAFPQASLEELTEKIEENSKTLRSMTAHLDNLSNVYVEKTSYNEKTELIHQQLMDLTRVKRREKHELDIITLTPSQLLFITDMNALCDEFAQVVESASTPRYQRLLLQLKSMYTAILPEVQPRFNTFEEKYKNLLSLLAKLSKRSKKYRHTDENIYDYYTRKFNVITSVLSYLKTRQDDYSRRMKNLETEDFASQSLDNQMLQMQLRTNFIVIADETVEVLKNLQKLEEEMDITDNGL